MDMVYLDHNATTPVDPQVRAAMMPLLGEVFGNPSSTHQAGQQAKAVLHEARRLVGHSLGADPRRILFTSGGTEADNLALFGMLPGRAAAGHTKLITCGTEHAAVREAAEAWEESGREVVWLPLKEDGTVDRDVLREELKGGAALVSVMWANNETGIIQPIAQIHDLCREAGVPLHTDAVQAWGKVPIDVNVIQPDLLSVSAHKVGGPKGVGALYVAEHLELFPRHLGGAQEKGLRPGTEPLPLIAGMGAAAELIPQRLAEMSTISFLRDSMEERLLAGLEGLRVIGRDSPRTGNTSSLLLPGVEGEAAVMALDMEGFCVSTGSACSSGRVAISPVIQALGYGDDDAKGAIRVSLGTTTTREEVDGFVEVMLEMIPALRG